MSAGYRPTLLDKPRAALRIAISLPAAGDFKAGFGYDLARLSAFTGMTVVADGIADLLFHMVEGTLISVARNSLVKMAQETGATHMLWLDTDMRFPKDTLLRLLERDVPVVGANYVTRRFPIRSVSYKTAKPRVRCRTLSESTGLEEVEGLGFGCVLVRMDVFAKIAFPWFTFPLDTESGTFTGEDIDFCMKAREQGFRIFVDHDLSKEIQHIGPFEYGHDHAATWIDAGLSEETDD